MDFEYVEEYRPSLRVQSGAAISRGTENYTVDRKQAVICISLGTLFLLLALITTAGALQFLTTWFAFALIAGPFAPSSITAGDCRVGRGEILPPIVAPVSDPIVSDKSSRSRKNARSRVADSSSPETLEEVKTDRKHGLPEQVESTENAEVDGEWSPEEISFLKKQLVKHPRGTARRWQVITEAFNGSRTVENVISMAKSLSEKKPGDEDSYTKFLQQRKVANKQMSSDASVRKELTYDNEEGLAIENGNGTQEQGWSDADDKLLLNSLKAFPRETPQRWEKVASAVHGKSKNQCVKRYLELRDGFRSSKAKQDADR